MSPDIEELWLFSKYGVPIADFTCSELKTDKSIIGGLVSAIKTFSQQLTTKGLQSLMLEDSKIVFFSALQGNVIMIIRTNSKAKDKRINKISIDIIRLFEDLYSINDIETWDGSTKFFKEFRERLCAFFNNL